MAIFFVTENYLKTVGVITDNTSVNHFSPLVEFAARAFVEDILGTYFFEDLLVKYNNQTLNADEEILVGYMQPAIGWRTCAHAGITLSNQLTNKGYQEQSGEFSTSVDLDTQIFLEKNYNQKALLFEERLKNYLISNKDDFPEFMSDLNKNSSVKNTCICGPKGGYNDGVGFFFV